MADYQEYRRHVLHRRWRRMFATFLALVLLVLKVLEIIKHVSKKRRKFITPPVGVAKWDSHYSENNNDFNFFPKPESVTAMIERTCPIAHHL